MGLLERIKNAIRTNLADIADRVDEPERRLRQLIGRMDADLADARLELGAVVREEDRLNKEKAAAEAEAAYMTEKARIALRDYEDEELAKEALRRCDSASERAEAAGREADLQRTTTEMFRAHVLALERKLEQARRQLEMVEARRRLADAQKSIGRRAVTGHELSIALQTRIDELDAETQAVHEVLAVARAEATGEDARIEQRLAELRAELRGDGRPADREGV